MTGSVRVLPLLMVAGLCLFALKSMGLLMSGGYVVSGVAPATAQNANRTAPSQAGEDSAAASADNANETPTKTPQGAENNEQKPTDPASADAAGGEQAKPGMANTAEPADGSPKDVTAESPKAQLAVLEGLANRRKDLDKREKQIDLRENLLKAAEKRVQARIAELKTIQAQIEGEMKKQDDYRKAQYASLVKMYSSMKPKDAARIFNRMDLEILTGIATQLKPRVMSAIMAAMDPAAAQRLTLEIANRGKPESKKAAALPKIEGRKTN